MESRLATPDTEIVATLKLGLTAAVVLGGIAAGAVLAVTILLG